ncbi:MAG TPA: Sec-dependent nitrous-oxide reductase [Gemmatimonadales bacterium]|nr:Sec-dependent nitrous-oxide reductase [Gemmatimonadales bacterium]HZH42422.1 Sec-dependent nitrous-oxide reductase [Gemmatimonadales bacterium]
MTVRHWIALASAALVGACTPSRAPSSGQNSQLADVRDAAMRTYVAPGKLDDYYLFYSGGHSGNVYVAGIPSMRHIITIPVFTPYPATGYGFDEDSKAMLGGYTWGDVHHPALSKTKGDYDGRWLFVNDNANNRLARIDLRDFKTKQILGPIPNSSGNHGSAFLTENSEYALVASRFSIPLPRGTYAPLSDYATKYHGVVSGIRIDSATGTMSVGWQIVTPPFDWDLASTGRDSSRDWVVWTSYNTERATGRLEVAASQRERDYMIFVNWRNATAAAAAGKGRMLDGVRVLDPRDLAGSIFLVPCAKSPHGADFSPDGRYVMCNGKLAPYVTVFDFQKFLSAAQTHDTVGNEDGIPVLRYESVRVAEVPVGLGPLHTQFDDQGYAYTSLFVESAVAKWKVGPFDGHDSSLVVAKIPVHYSVGHLVVAGGDTRHPYGKYLVSMNKLSKGQHLDIGPSQPESSELIDITGTGMTELYEAFTEPEPHFAQIAAASLLHPIEVYPKEENKDPNAIWAASDAKVTRRGNVVEVKLYAIRSYFAPNAIEVNQGDSVIIHVTNAEQERDMLHGFGIASYNINLVLDPGETKTVAFRAGKTGVYPFYCTNFCSAMHQEMQGYLLVKPRGGAGAAASGGGR